MNASRSTSSSKISKAILWLALASTVDSTASTRVQPPGGQAPPIQTVERGISEPARAYLTKALDAMEKHSMRTKDIDWASLRSTTFKKAATAQTTADTYDAIRWAVEELKDGHSFFSTPAPRRGSKPAADAPTFDSAGQAGAGHAPLDGSAAAASLPKKKTRTVEGAGWVIASTAADMRSEVITSTTNGQHRRVGYILVPSFGGQESFDPTTATAFATALQEQVRQLDIAGATAWIVDLRYNSGGNMWPMLAGIGPLLGVERVGSFYAEGQQPVGWLYKDGKAGTPGSVSVTIEKPWRLREPAAKVAVLVGKYCTSSGEAIAVALRGRERSRFFGKPTGGATTSTQTVWMGDGAMLFVTNAIYADRTGKVYGGKLEPDEVVPESPDELTDPAPAWSADSAIRAAIRWLRDDS
jgi:hypothetical protein